MKSDPPAWTERDAMYAEGLSDRQIAARLGLDRATIRHWRRTKNLPPNFVPAALAPPERRERYDAGMNDTRMALLEGITKASIVDWRERNKLKANHDFYNRPADEDKRRRRLLFYSLGWDDVMMARQENCKVQSIFSWRKRLGLTANRKPGRGPETVGTPINDIMSRIRRAVGRGLPRDLADDAVANMFAALLDGTLPIADIEKTARKFGNKVLDSYASKFGPRSLDEDISDDGDGFRMIDMLKDDNSSSWLEEMGATVW
ncbi:helix-turn-helix domain-containing protein [Sphingomonas sp. M6A6_1c]